MYAEERRQQLVQLAREDGRVAVTVAAKRFEVTPETIRRDLEALDRAGLLQRVHGGAMLPNSNFLGDLGLGERDASASAEKDLIARAAATLLPADTEDVNRAIILDAGTTTARLAELFPASARWTVFTNSLPIASALSSHTQVAVELVGGRVRGLTQACVGGHAVERLSSIRVDLAFLGANGVSLEHGLSTPDGDEAQVKRQMMRSARKVVLLADARKLGAETTTRFASLDEMDVLVTDAITATQSEKLTKLGIEVVTA